MFLWVALTILCKTTKPTLPWSRLAGQPCVLHRQRCTFLRGCEQSSVGFQMLFDGACSTCALPVHSSCMRLLLGSYQASQPVYCLCRCVKTLCCCCSTAAAAGASCGSRVRHQMPSALQSSLADATPIGIAAGHRCVQCICCDTVCCRTSSGFIVRLCSVDAPTCMLTGTTGQSETIARGSEQRTVCHHRTILVV